ncbi:Putative transcription factor Opi1 [Septoria linicola]|uniref:Transcription factor Opi1 n=1 Tax=Septoria linicola TaxID=215465 RepID=A0A9Q9ANY4_9PEZI|nr:Putative transcription factor Opi1 [Septoria linicola]
MEAVQSRPSSALSRSPETVEWPAVPRHEIRSHNDVTLPDLKTVLSPEFERMSAPRQQSPQSVRSLPRIDPGHVLLGEGGADVTMASPVDTASVVSMEDRNGRATSVVSMEDPDVRDAAEALSGLGNPEYSRGSRNQSRHMSHASSNSISNAEFREDPEPILELIAQAHPWVGGAVKTSLAAYSTTKGFTPRIVQGAANLMERNTINVASSVGGLTGIDAGVRRYLQSRRPGDVEAGHVEKQDTPMLNGDAGRHRQEAQLPPYSGSRPPSYREEASPMRPPHQRNWSSQFWVTTGGLSVALSYTSRKSLRICLTLLRDAAAGVEHLSRALQICLEQYESTRAQQNGNDGAILEKGQRPSTPERNEQARHLAEQIQQTCNEIMNRLHIVVKSVSDYTGGVLPENAKDFVRRQLMSLPERWQIVSRQQAVASETSRNARRMIDFAGEGLEVMSQVSGVLKATLDSAEQWLMRVGRSDNDQDQEMGDAPHASQRPEIMEKS